MSFSEIAALPKVEKDTILGKLRPSKREEYDEFELQAANQEADNAAVRKQAANQEADNAAVRKQAANQEADNAAIRKQAAIEKLNQINKDLQSSTDTIRSISSLPKDIEQQAMDHAMKNPPKELANIPPGKYGEYKNLILAEYSINNRVEILKKLSNEDKSRFTDAISSAGEIL